MTKDDAISAMRKGKKVRHRHFSDNEFITMQEGKIVDENGYKLDVWEFWFYRQDASFNTDWEVVNN